MQKSISDIKMESYSVSTKKIINNLLDISPESDDANNNKTNPYDTAPTLVALIQSNIKENEQNDENSDRRGIHV